MYDCNIIKTILNTDKLDEIVDKCNKKCHRNETNLTDMKSGEYIEYSVDHNDKDPKYNAGDHLIIPQYKNSFAKGYASNWSEEIFIFKEVENTVPCLYVIGDYNGEKIIRKFYEKELQRTNQIRV